MMPKVKKVKKNGYHLWACSVCGQEFPLRRDAEGCCYKEKESK